MRLPDIIQPDHHPDVLTTAEFHALERHVADAVLEWLGLPPARVKDLVKVQCFAGHNEALCHFRYRDVTGATVFQDGHRVLTRELVTTDPRFAEPPWFGTRSHYLKAVGRIIET